MLTKHTNKNHKSNEKLKVQPSKLSEKEAIKWLVLDFTKIVK